MAMPLVFIRIMRIFAFDTYTLFAFIRFTEQELRVTRWMLL